METWSAFASLAVFVGVFACIITESLSLTFAAMLGAMLLLSFDVLTFADAVNYIAQGYTTLAFSFGVVVILRSFAPTGEWAYLATQIGRRSSSHGKRPSFRTVAIRIPLTHLAGHRRGRAVVALNADHRDRMEGEFYPPVVANPATFIVENAVP